MTISEIISALENAPGPSRELDAEIAVLLDIRPKWLESQRGAMWFDGKDRILWRDEMMVAGPGNPTAWHAAEWIKGDSLPSYTESLDAAVALAERVLPGWGWVVGTCWVSDDARVFPDYNSPVHGDRLRREFPERLDIDRGPEWPNNIEWVDYTDVDQRPPKSVAMALCRSILIAVEKIAELKNNDGEADGV